jgi:hypothetical protein
MPWVPACAGMTGKVVIPARAGTQGVQIFPRCFSRDSVSAAMLR